MAAAGTGVTSFFHGNGLSVAGDPVSVLVATCTSANAEHIHVLNRRNYCRIPEIESAPTHWRLDRRAGDCEGAAPVRELGPRDREGKKRKKKRKREKKKEKRRLTTVAALQVGGQVPVRAGPSRNGRGDNYTQQRGLSRSDGYNHPTYDRR